MRKALLFGSVGLACWWSASPANACSIAAPPPALHGYPEDGATNVPTDVVPIYDTVDADVYSDDLGELQITFSLRPADGEDVELTMQPSHNWWMELSPAAALEPHTRYVLEARPGTDSRTGLPGVPLRLEFTTGAGPVSELPPAPTASVQEWQFAKNVPLDSCSFYERGTCIALPSGQFVETHYSTAEGFAQSPVYVYLARESAVINLHGDSEGETFRCVQLRTRAPNGQYGEPSVYCDADAAKFEIGHSASLQCTSRGLLHEGELVTASRTARLLQAGAPLPGEPLTDVVSTRTHSGACALGARAPRPACFAWSMVAAAAWAARRRRSRRV